MLSVAKFSSGKQCKYLFYSKTYRFDNQYFVLNTMFGAIFLI